MTSDQTISTLATVLSLALALGPRPAMAGESTWADTLDTPAVEAHVAAHGGNVVIVRAGKRSNDLREVARALRAELEEGGTTGRITLEEAEGRLADADDATLVSELAADADRVAIVRVADGRATISVYDAAGTAIGGFSAARGDTIEVPPETSHTGDSVLTVIEDAPELEGDALAEYERKRVVFDGTVHVTATGSNSAVLTRGFEPRTGAGAPLPKDEFYTYIGREDLAKRYRRRNAVRVGLLAGGGLTAATGLTLMLALPLAAVIQEGDASLECDTFECSDAADARQKQRVGRGLGIGGGLLVGGIAMLVVGGKIRPHTATAAEVQQMGEQYNEDLRKELGVRRIAIRGAANRHGGSVVLSGRF
ncbi:MAG: hypothetical protein AAGF11_12270 [Myxococcota bacterium]